MLHKMHFEYENGSIENTIIYTSPGEQLKIDTLNSGIRFMNHKTLRYKISKHPYLSPCIVRFSKDEYFIMPHNIPCHPKTKLSDIDIIEDKTPIKKETPRYRTWNFKSSSGEGEYTVREDMGKLKCNCFGWIRSKDKSIGCKHTKEVRNNLNKK